VWCAGLERESLAITRMQPNFFFSHNRDAWRESKSCCPFFRSLLGVMLALGHLLSGMGCECRLKTVFEEM
jgi:hypothetical protein